jgi:hypothetical protein
VRAGVLEHVCQAFLDDAVRRLVEPFGDGGKVTVDADLDLDSSLANLGHQADEVAESRAARGAYGRFLPSRGSARAQSAFSITTWVPSGFTSRTGTLTSRTPFP